MATLREFLTHGQIGPIALGVPPTEVINMLGDADDTSPKSNPLRLTYGCLQLTFWKSPQQSRHQLRSIVLFYQPQVEPYPKALDLLDFKVDRTPTENEFRAYMHRVNSMPSHLIEGPTGRQLLFPSSVVVLFIEGFLNSIRLEQRAVKNLEHIPTLGLREPSQEQILSMMQEAVKANGAGASRSALLIGWAALEATLRRVAARAGLKGRLDVQPSVLIRELLTAGKLRPDERDILEELRQIRSSVAHGLAPLEFDTDTIPQIQGIVDRLLRGTGPILRKRKELDYIVAVEAIEAYSVLAKTQHYKSLADFFKLHGLQVHIDVEAIGGADPQHAILVGKDVDFPTFNRLLGEWKDQISKA